MGFLELLSALRFGRLDLKSDALHAIQSFRQAHLHNNCYAAPNLEILYLGFRHKIAHLTHPHSVFDTHTQSKLRGYPRMLIAWTIESRQVRAPAIRTEATPGLELVGTLRPWRVPYDHRITIVLGALARDLIGAAASYQRELRASPERLTQFMAAIEPYYPR